MKHSLKRIAARDALLRGPLSDPSLADSSVIEQYLELTHSNRRIHKKQDLESETEDNSLPPFETLRRTPHLSTLFDYQIELAEQIERTAALIEPDNVGLLALPTGAGKTRTALYALIQLITSGTSKRALWLAPSRELLDQAFRSARKLWAEKTNAPSMDLYRSHALKEFPPSSTPSLYFATPQMVYKRVARRASALPPFDLIVFDEAHQVEAPTFKQVVRKARQLSAKACPVIGLSATPGRVSEEETESLVAMFKRRLLVSETLKPNAITSLQSRGILARIEFKKIPIPIKLVGAHRTIESKDQVRGATKQLESDVVRFKAVLENTLELSANGKGLLFAGSIAHANALAVVLRHKGCKAASISARTPLPERERILEAFESGELTVLVNKSILATGYDCPAVSFVTLSMPIGSPILFEQIVGRGSRGPMVGGNQVNEVWQLDDNLKIHGRPSSYHRFKDFDWK